MTYPQPEHMYGEVKRQGDRVGSMDLPNDTLLDKDPHCDAETAQMLKHLYLSEADRIDGGIREFTDTEMIDAMEKLRRMKLIIFVVEGDHIRIIPNVALTAYVKTGAFDWSQPMGNA